MKHTLIKGKIDFSCIISNSGDSLIHFKPNNSALLNKVHGNYFYRNDRPLSLLLDGIDVAEMEFKSAKRQKWWQDLSDNNDKTSDKPVFDDKTQVLPSENEFTTDAFILVHRIIAENQAPVFLYLGQTNTSDGHKFIPGISTIKKSMNGMILSRLNSSSFAEEQHLSQSSAA